MTGGPLTFQIIRAPCNTFLAISAPDPRPRADHNAHDPHDVVGDPARESVAPHWTVEVSAPSLLRSVKSAVGYLYFLAQHRRAGLHRGAHGLGPGNDNWPAAFQPRKFPSSLIQIDLIDYDWAKITLEEANPNDTRQQFWFAGMHRSFPSGELQADDCVTLIPAFS